MDYLQKVTKADLVTVEMKRLLGKGDSLMPHQIAAMLGIRSEEALELLVKLEGEGYCKIKQLIYHHCSEAPVGVLKSWGETAIPWTCPHCEEVVETQEDWLKELTFDVIAVSTSKP
jgi:hypothetical protein